MKCEDFESNVNDLAREQMMEASIRAQALAHRGECEACTRRLDDESALSFRLRALASETNNVSVPPLSDELLNALRSNRVAMNQINNRWRYWAAAGVAIAAVVLVVIAVAVMRSRSVTPETVQGAPSPSKLASVPTPIASTPNVVLGEKHERRETTVGSRRVTGKRSGLTARATQSAASRPHEDTAATETATSVTEDSPTEITTDFMPVGYANAANMQDGGQLVRVELSRSALVAFGLPMNVNRYDEKVKADVFFGVDGMARAIRFVQ